jgi:hypothetical protein
MSPKTKATKKPRRHKTTNPRGGRPTADEIGKMTGLGYVSVADAAKAVNRAGSNIYDRIRAKQIPQKDPKLKPVVKTASGNVWVHLDSVKSLFADPAALATEPQAAS